jgi:hypothetical protein
MFDMTYFSDRRLHEGLAWMGQFDWTDLTPASNKEHRWRKATFPVEVPEFAKLAVSITRSFDGETYGLLYGLSKLHAVGPKVLRPTFNMCLALEQVDINLPFEDYAQPYEALIIAFPQEWQKYACAKFGVEKAPELVTAVYFKGGVLLHTWFTKHDSLCSVVANRPEFNTMEDALRIAYVPDKERGLWNRVAFEKPHYELSILVQRLTLNFCLLATHVGTKEVGWLQPKERVRHERMRERDPRRAMFMAGDIMQIGLAQEIKLYQEVTLRAPRDGSGTHASPPPHWRRGHWRNQPYGPRNSLRKRKLLKAVFVRPFGYNGPPLAIETDYNLLTRS